MNKKNGIWLLASVFCINLAIAQTGTLTKKEIKDGWLSLFDGKSLDGWQKSNGQPFNGKGWVVGDNPASVTICQKSMLRSDLEFLLRPVLPAMLATPANPDSTPRWEWRRGSLPV